MRAIRKYVREVLSESLDKVYTTADYAHLGQKRRTGEPYIVHPERVSEIVNQYYPSNNVAKMTALLHDTLEDAIDLGNVADEEEMIALIDDSIENEAEADEVINSVLALTKPVSVDYESYLLSILNQPNAVIVKMADMLDNLTDNPSEKQKQKYKKALETIENHFGGAPSFINPAHWADLLNAIK
jgi:GTP diphosphokinase / guanosine-3',5'-bis(diphosphate) 3'-diphosphatase